MTTRPVLALVLALLCLGQQASAADIALGRLFHTPQQRTQFDRMRQYDLAVDTGNSAFLTITGEVRRSSGQDMHWINGQALPGSRAGEAGQMPVGDRIERRSGDVQNLLRDGQLHIKRPPR